MSTKQKLLRGLAAVCATLCALMFGAEIVAGEGDYKTLVDGFLGGGAAAAGGSAETYAFTSDYDSLADLLTERKRIAEQIGEEGAVLLKNETLSSGKPSLPLRGAGEIQEVRATVLGSRPYTYKANGDLRDSYLTFYGGETGSPIRRQSVTLADGSVLSLPVTLDRALASENITVNPNLVNFYSEKPYPALPEGGAGSGTSGKPYEVDEPYISLSDVQDFASYSDAAIVVIGRSSGEGRDYYPGQTGVVAGGTQTCSIGLSDNERRLVDVAAEISDNVIVLVNSAVAMELDELQKNEKVDSIVWICIPGSYALTGVARVLSGAAAFSGHLPDTYAVSASGSPAAQNFGIYTQTDASMQFTWSSGTKQHNSSDDSHYVVLAEGLYTGYRYYETRYFDSVTGSGNATSSVGSVSGEWNYANEVTYPFGYGASYTTFEQSFLPEPDFRYDLASKTVSLSVNVKNTGNVPARDVVQLYVSVPYTDYDRANGVEKSAIQLVAFAKTDVLYPAEQADEEHPNEQTIPLTVDLKYVASYDKTVDHDSARGGYILEAGDYYFAIGNGAHEAVNNVLAAQGADAEKLVSQFGAEPDADKAYRWDPDEEDPVTSGFSFNGGVDSSYFSHAAGDESVVVSNQMENADYNYFKADTVTYLSRSDWEGTFPRPYPFLDETDGMQDYLNDRVYQFSTSGSTDVEFGVDHSEEEDENGNPAENLNVAAMKLAAFDDENWEYLLSQVTFDEAWHFAPYGGSRCDAFASVNSPEVFQIDGPNGNVTRPLGERAPKNKSDYLAIPADDPNAGYISSDMPAAPVTAATFHPELLTEQGRIYGEDNLWSRNPIMWAPGMNLHRTPFNSRNHEYYSEDPMLTNILGVSFVRGGLEKGAILAAKHFAFNTQESFREGLIQFMEEQSARELELRAFQGICEDVNFVNSAGNTVNALGVMTSFSRTGVCNVNAHTGVMKNILRGEWGFKGLSSTDMVAGSYYFNPQDGVINNVTFMATSSAGTLLESGEWKPMYGNKKLVESDPAMRQALHDNMHYYFYAIANSIALNGIAPDDVIELGHTSWWEYMLYALGGVFAAGAVACGAFIAVDAVKKRKQEADHESDHE